MYTVNINQYRPERTDIKCYTEDKLGNPHYSSRLYKILSHIYDSGEWSVYVDADIFFPEGMEEKLIEEVKASGKLVGVFKHPWRDCLFDEGEEVIKLGLDEEIYVRSFLNALEKIGAKKHGGLYACGVLVRKNCKEVEEANSYWWEMVCVGSKRDQISFPIAFDGNIHVFEGDIYNYKRK